MAASSLVAGDALGFLIGYYPAFGTGSLTPATLQGYTCNSLYTQVGGDFSDVVFADLAGDVAADMRHRKLRIDGIDYPMAGNPIYNSSSNTTGCLWKAIPFVDGVTYSVEVQAKDLPDIEIVGYKSAAFGGAFSGTHSISLTDLTHPEGGSSPTLAENDMVYLVIGTARDGSTLDLVADVNTSGYTTLATSQWGGGAGARTVSGIFEKRMGATPDTSVVVEPSGVTSAALSVSIIVARNVDTSTSMDVSVPTPAETQGSMKADPPSITPVTTGAMMLFFAAAGGGADNDLLSNFELFDLTTIWANDTTDCVTVCGAKPWTSGAYNLLPFELDPADDPDTATANSHAFAIALRPAVADTTDPTFTSAAAVDVETGTTLSHLLTADESATFSIVGGADQAEFELNGANEIRFASNGTRDFSSPADANTDNDYELTVRATDGASNTKDQAITVTVTAAPSGPTPDFKILRGSSIIPSGQTTLALVNTTDYTLESGIASDAWFFQIANSNLSGMGRTSGGGNQNSDDFMTSISTSGNNVTLTRRGSANDCRVDWQIIQYIGEAGGANEMKVRGVGTADTAIGGTTVSVAIPGSVVSNADLVPFITGQDNSDTSRNQVHGGLHTAVINGSNIDFQAGDPTPISTVSYAFVEFTGSNWTVTNELFANPSASSTDSPVTLGTAVSDIAKTFLHCQYRYDLNGTAGLDDGSVRVQLSSTTQLLVRDTTTTGDASKNHSIWLIQNPDITVARYTGTMAGSGEEEVADITITAVDDIDQTLTTLTNDSTGSGTAFPRGFINHLLTDATTVRLRQSDNGQTSLYALEVISFPESVASSGVNGTLTATIDFTGSGLAVSKIEGIGSGLLTITGSAAGTVIAAGIVGTLTGQIDFTGSSSAKAIIEATGGGSVSFSSSSTGVAPVAASGSGDLVITGTGLGSSITEAIGAGGLVITGSSFGASVVSGSGSGIIAFTASSIAASMVKGSGSGDLIITGTATGAGSFPGISGTAIGLLTISATSSGSSPIDGIGAGDLILTASSAGAAIVAASGSGLLTITGVAVGSLPIDAVGSGQISFVASSSGSSVVSATGAGVITLTASASGSVTAISSGSLVATFTITGSSQAKAPIAASGSGQFDILGTAQAKAIVEASVSGLITLTGASSARSTISGAANASLIITGSATAASPIYGQGAGLVSFVVSALAVIRLNLPSPPERTICSEALSREVSTFGKIRVIEASSSTRIEISTDNRTVIEERQDRSE